MFLMFFNTLENDFGTILPSILFRHQYLHRRATLFGVLVHAFVSSQWILYCHVLYPSFHLLAGELP